MKWEWEWEPEPVQNENETETNKAKQIHLNVPSDDGHSEKRLRAGAPAKVTKLNSKLINWLIHLTVNGFSLARTKFRCQKKEAKNIVDVKTVG